MIMFALVWESFYEQRTSHNVRTLWGALDDWPQLWGVHWHDRVLRFDTVHEGVDHNRDTDATIERGMGQHRNHAALRCF